MSWLTPIDEKTFTFSPPNFPYQSIPSKISDLLIKVETADDETNDDILFAEIEDLLPQFSSDDYENLISRNGFKKLLNKFQHTPSAQAKLTFILAEKSFELADLHPKHAQTLCLRTIYYATSTLRIFPTEVVIDRVNQLTSRVFILMTHLKLNLVEKLNRSKGDSDPTPFVSILNHIENVKYLWYGEQSKEDISRLYDKATEVERTIGSESTYKKYFKVIPEKRHIFATSAQPIISRYREALKHFRNGFTDVEHTHSLRELQNKLFLRFQSFFNVLVHDVFIILGPPPCHFDLRAMGSIGREEASPFSDLEFFILISEDTPANKDYFKNFCEVLRCQVMVLGEVEVSDPQANFNNQVKIGFHIDIGGDPLNNPELIETPFEIAKKQITVEMDCKSIENTLLKSQSLYQTSPKLFNDYRTEVTHHLDANSNVNELSQRQWRTLEYIKWRIKDFKSIRFNPDSLNIKQAFIEPLNHLLSDMAIYWGINAINTLDVIDELVQKEIFNSNTGRLLKETVELIFKIRCRLHVCYGEQKDEALCPPSEKIGNVWLTSQELEDLERIRLTIIKPLYDFLKIIFSEANSIAEINDQFKKNFHQFSLDPTLQAVWEMTTFVSSGNSVKVGHPNFTKPRYLKSEVASLVLDTSGHIKKDYKNCGHRVTHLKHNRLDIHLKEKPTHPLMEYLVHQLMNLIAGTSLTPSTQLMRFEIESSQLVYPVLLSQTIPGKILDNSPLNWNDFTDQQKEHWTKMFLCTLLIRPGDGRPSNYILDSTENIFCVDNDIAFVEPVTTPSGIRTLINSPNVQFTSILFCLFDQISLSKSALKNFCDLGVREILINCIDKVIILEKEYGSLFHEEELERLYNEDEENRFKATLVLPQNTFETLYVQFIRLQNFLKINLEIKEGISPLELLKELVYLRRDRVDEVVIGPRIYEKYRKALKKHVNYLDRLNFIRSLSVDQSLNSQQSDIFCYGKVLPWIDVKPKMCGLEELKKTLVDQLFCSFDPTFVQKSTEHGKKGYLKCNFQGRDAENQRFLLKLLKTLPTPMEFSFTIENSSALNDSLLKIFLDDNIRVLNLSGCPNITDVSILNIQEKCPQLEELYLRGCTGIPAIRGAVSPNISYTLSPWRRLNFPQLRRLDIDGCEKLTTIKIKAPRLEEISTKKCPSTSDFEINSICLSAKKSPLSCQLLNLVIGKSSTLTLSDSISSSDVRMIIDFLQLTDTLQEIIIDSVQISEDDLESLFIELKRYPLIRVLKLRSWQINSPTSSINPALTELVRDNTSLHEIEFFGSSLVFIPKIENSEENLSPPVDYFEIRSLIEGLQGNTKVKVLKLNFGSRQFGHIFIPFVTMLKNHISLEEIIFSQNPLRDNELAYVIENLKFNRSVRVLKLLCCEINIKIVTRIIDLLKSHPVLSEVEISSSHEKLRFVKTSKENLQIIVENSPSLKLEPLFEMLSNDPILTKLELKCSFLHSDQVIALAGILKKTNSLKAIDLSESQIKDKMIVQLIEALLINRSVTIFKIKELTSSLIDIILQLLATHPFLRKINLQQEGHVLITQCKGEGTFQILMQAFVDSLLSNHLTLPKLSKNISKSHPNISSSEKIIAWNLWLNVLEKVRSDLQKAEGLVIARLFEEQNWVQALVRLNYLAVEKLPSEIYGPVIDS